MDQEPEVIYTYTDAQAVEDGVLVAVPFAPVNRITRMAFDYFARPMGTSPVTGPVIDITPVRKVIEAMLAVEADEGGWRSGTYEGKEPVAHSERSQRTHLDVSGRLLRTIYEAGLELTGFLLNK